MKNIEKKKKIVQLIGLSETKNNIVYRGLIGNEIIFPFAKKQFIEFFDDEKIYFLDNVNEKIFTLTKSSFEFANTDLNILDEIGSVFNLQKEAHKNDSFSYRFNTTVIYDSCSIAFKKCTNADYCMLFGIRREREAMSMAEDMFSGNIFYIESIWQIKLSEDFKTKIFDDPKIITTKLQTDGCYVYESGEIKIELFFSKNSEFKKTINDANVLQTINGVYTVEEDLVCCNCFTENSKRMYFTLSTSEELSDSELRKYKFFKTQPVIQNLE